MLFPTSRIPSSFQTYPCPPSSGRGTCGRARRRRAPVGSCRRRASRSARLPYNLRSHHSTHGTRPGPETWDDDRTSSRVHRTTYWSQHVVCRSPFPGHGISLSDICVHLFWSVRRRLAKRRRSVWFQTLPRQACPVSPCNNRGWVEPPWWMRTLSDG